MSHDYHLGRTAQWMPPPESLRTAFFDTILNLLFVAIDNTSVSPEVVFDKVGSRFAGA